MQSVKIKVAAIDAFYDQPRQTFDQSTIEELAASMTTYGQLEPIHVRPHPSTKNRFQLISGERRWRAAQHNEWVDIEAVVRTDVTDELLDEAAVVANAAREDLTTVDAARCAKRLAALPKHAGLTRNALCQKLAPIFGRSAPWVDGILSIAELAPDVQELVQHGSMAITVAIELAAIPTHARQIEMANRILSEGMRAGPAVSLVQNQVRVELAREEADNPGSGSAGHRFNGFPRGRAPKEDSKLIAELVTRIRQSAESALDMPTDRLAKAYKARTEDVRREVARIDGALLLLTRLKRALLKLVEE